MKAYDFEYDGLKLSSFGYMICNFGSNGLQTVSVGSQITFNTVSIMNGSQYHLASIEYKDCLKTTFQICKNGCGSGNFEMTAGEERLLSRWLNRNEFKKFKILNADYIDVYFEGSFNISRLEFNGMVCGFELELITNRPYALQETRTKTIFNVKPNTEHVIKDYSEIEGFIYPKTEIEINEAGTLEIYNASEDRTTAIRDCLAGEKIIMNYPVITTSAPGHKIQNDFNWKFFRLFNSFRNSGNKITISLPCTMKLSYSPPVRLSL